MPLFRVEGRWVSPMPKSLMRERAYSPTRSPGVQVAFLRTWVEAATKCWPPTESSTRCPFASNPYPDFLLSHTLSSRCGMAYRVCVSEGFIRPLPYLFRGCIRSELKRVAEQAESEPGRAARSDVFSTRRLRDGSWISSSLAERRRTVKLMGVGR